MQALLNELRSVNVTFYEQIFDSVLTGSFYDRFRRKDADQNSVLDAAAEELFGGLASWRATAELLGFQKH